MDKVHLFTKEGSTFTFLNIRDFSFNESIVSFSFRAQSDGHTKRATFFVKNLAGFTQLVYQSGTPLGETKCLEE